MKVIQRSNPFITEVSVLTKATAGSDKTIYRETDKRNTEAGSSARYGAVSQMCKSSFWTEVEDGGSWSSSNSVVIVYVHHLTDFQVEAEMVTQEERSILCSHQVALSSSCNTDAGSSRKPPTAAAAVCGKRKMDDAEQSSQPGKIGCKRTEPDR